MLDTSAKIIDVARGDGPEVTADIASPILDEGDGRYRVVLEPDLDQTDRRQLRGCIEDWTIDHLLVDVVAFETAR